jgi:hypothetical protein
MKFIYIILIMIAGLVANAGFPPTTSKISSDSANVTTFNYLFPNFTGTHTGTTVSLGVNSIAGGGTNNGSLAVTAGGVLYADGSKVMNSGAGTSGYGLISNGSSPPSWSPLLTNPLTTTGDLIYGVSTTPTRLAAGTTGQALQTNGSSSAPSWVGSVMPDTTALERIGRVRFGGGSDPSNCTGSPCTINSQSGSWLTSVTRSATGKYTLNFAASFFSAQPACVCTAKAIGVDRVVCVQSDSAGSSSSKEMWTTLPASAGAFTDSYLEVICMGPR